MRHAVHVLAIPGSLRRASHTTALLQAAADLAPDGVEIALYDGLADVPPYDQDLDTDAGPDAHRARLTQIVRVLAEVNA